ncbi:WD40 repeat-like protein [Ramaria rubella]|nr:WD40 repeat-like protein [Ramaria rubella]
MLHSFKDKLVKNPSTKERERLKKAFSDAISTVELTKAITKDVGIALPGLQAGLGGLLFVLNAIQKTFQNADDIEQLSKRLEKLLSILENAKKGRTLSPLIANRIDRFSETWNADIESLKKIASRSIVRRLARTNEDAKKISDHLQAMTWSIQDLTAESVLAIEFALEVSLRRVAVPSTLTHQQEHTQDMRHALADLQSGVDSVGKRVDSGFQRVNSTLDITDGHAPHAVFARYDCGNRVPCLDGTRSDIIDQIKKWIDQDSNTVTPRDAAKSRIFWIKSSAGTGKTTIAYTIAQMCDKSHMLGASFFCSRDNAECSNPKFIFTTIANHLGHHCPAFGDEIAHVLKRYPDIGYADVSRQLEELIMKPLQVVGKSFQSCVVVIDALDECKEDKYTSSILHCISNHIDGLLRLKFLITSRPEPNITVVFKSSTLKLVTHPFVLHEVNLEVVEKDIEDYLTIKLADIQTFYGYNESWPLAADIQALSKLSCGLFIFAATSVKFIADKNYDNPVDQLRKLLHSATVMAEEASPHHHLDQLYMQVLNQAYPTLSDGAGQLKRILGSIILLFDPLSASGLEQLLNIKSPNLDSPVQAALHCLHSVVIVPEDNSHVLRLLHPSFYDFLTNSGQCKNPKLLVNVEAQHTLLALRCLSAMQNLKQNVCGIEDPTKYNSEIKDLPQCIMHSVPPHLQYACHHWASHLEHALLSETLMELLYEFYSKYMLFWIEVGSLLQGLHGQLLSLYTVQKVVAKSGNKHVPHVVALLSDCQHFLQEFFPIISAASQQVYHSALLFTPKQTKHYKTYSHMSPQISMKNICKDVWSSCLWTIDGYAGGVQSVAFSPDGTHIVSGSNNKTLQLWDGTSGMHLNTLTGHSGGVLSVAFSPDGTHIVSGSSDTTVRLWDAASGVHLNTLTGHSCEVLSVAFSPDGTHIVSGSSDTTVQLWNAASGLYLNTFTGHTDWVQSVAFSPDGTHIVSGSDDNTLRLWDTVSGVHLNTLTGHTDFVLSVAFSPDGAHIVSGSRDKTLQLWDAASGVHLNTLTGHTDWVQSVAFSPNGIHIVSGSDDRTV